MPSPEEVASLFRFGLSYAEIGAKFGVNKNVIAGICHRNKIRRSPKPEPVISAAELAERAQDQRDLDMLSDVEEGHSMRSTAKFWGVPYSRVHELVVARRAAE